MQDYDATKLNLSDVPREESQQFEFKSSKTQIDKLADKLRAAVSGLANSGGGFFIAGVNGSGDADGGYEAIRGNKSLLDWVDQAIQAVVPIPTGITRALIFDLNGRGTLKQDCAVLVVGVPPSTFPPHQVSGDGIYYVRAGTHTQPGSHYLVEALWARRQLSSLKLLVRLELFKADNLDFYFLAVLEPLTGVPLLNVSCEVNDFNYSDGRRIKYHADAISSQSPGRFFLGHRDAVARADFDLRLTYEVANTVVEKQIKVDSSKHFPSISSWGAAATRYMLGAV